MSTSDETANANVSDETANANVSDETANANVSEINYYLVDDIVYIHNIDKYVCKKHGHVLVCKYDPNKHITKYSVSDKNLTEITDTILNTVERFYCQCNMLTHLPEILPEHLRIMHCFNNKLTELPAKLPSGLIELMCNNNELIELPKQLPPSLTHLYCHNNKLTKLPEVLPPTLKILNCHNNELTLLPDLPQTLEKITLTGNRGLRKHYPHLFSYYNVKDIIKYVNKCNAKMVDNALLVMSYFHNTDTVRR